MSVIKFGTDGWRAIVGEDFIPSNVEKVIQAFCDWRTHVDSTQKQIILGYDCRNQSPETAKLVAEILAGNGFEVFLSSQFCPTPCVSWMVKNSKAFAGIMVTASHNPFEWNGIKFKEAYGGSASPEYTSFVEKKIIENEKNHSQAKKVSFEVGLTKKLIRFFDPNSDYVNQLKSLVDLNVIKKANYRVLYDAIHGAGSGFLEKILGEQVVSFRGTPDIHFGGVNPEPIDKNLQTFLNEMKTGHYDLGLATDGDADRIGAASDDGVFVNSHQIFALLLQHYVEDKGLKGVVVKSVSTTQMIPKLCKKYGLTCLETPIGFKHICEELVKHDALMGGEESGGISFFKHVHERDGLLNGLMLLEMMSQRKKSLRQLIKELYAEIGEFYFDRIDCYVRPDQITRLKEKLSQESVASIAGQKVTSINTLDGFKYVLKDESWLLIRASGTEPLVRIYAEASSNERVKALLEFGNNVLKNG